VTGAARRVSLEHLLCLPIVAALVYAVWFFATHHYLPQPFSPDPAGTGTDWYSLTRWSREPGAYEIERSIYPPLSFVLMRVFTLPGCYAPDMPADARGCDGLGFAALILMWAIGGALTWLTFRKIDRSTAAPRAVAMTFGLPMLYALERGNVVVFAYACMLLGFGPLLRRAWLRWVFAGLAVNFKVYLIGAIFAPLLKRRWRAVAGMSAAAGLIYLATWAMLGDGSPVQIVRNVLHFSGASGAAAARNLWYPATYLPLGELLADAVPDRPGAASALVLAATVLTRAMQAIILTAAAAAWLRPAAATQRRAVLLAVALALSASEAGGYTEMFVLLFVFTEPMRGRTRAAALLIAYLLSVPFDVTVTALPPEPRWSWLAGVEVVPTYGVGALTLLRPGLTMAMAALLAGSTIADAWRAR
jgi:hypothetical protein